ncbi:NTE family protein [Rhodovulum sulfidophilum]|uniref:patatin-like phospholipase family protein n=1 Tax=Rhodovulum sulfidophilum TaxID=35806 RepID=UPI0005A862E5|nr:patatin-like phospholipase family protein [Rhodovulum sulfidophilum]ANB36200.1 patatin [Rhodovulum sulfidophilum DSM 1374]ANB40006.1 patatin [Rhodovulum sulfidophilum]MCW2302233.1 NTE family protein [Rhodovulum sulfidophilum]
MTTLRINLALQGGGAHGAFTWGVLDRLLRDPEIEIAAISGASAGAMNGAAVKSGLVSGGCETARENLDWFWQQVGAVGDMRLTSWMMAFLPGAGAVAQFMEQSMPISLIDTASRSVSPYALGPFYRNPLERVVRRLDFERVCARAEPLLFVGATNVRTGKVRIFKGDEIDGDVLLASACLPTLFQAVEIDDPDTGRTEAYWDGGYTGNPALFPLFAPELPEDIVVVSINPMERDEVPTTPQDIQNRINEISFNSSLLRELRTISQLEQLIAEGRIDPGSMKLPRIHMISDDGPMNSLSIVTKLMPSPIVLAELKAAGEAAAERFLCETKPNLQKASSVDLRRICADG